MRVPGLRLIAALIAMLAMAAIPVQAGSWQSPQRYLKDTGGVFSYRTTSANWSYWLNYETYIQSVTGSARIPVTGAYYGWMVSAEPSWFLPTSPLYVRSADVDPNFGMTANNGWVTVTGYNLGWAEHDDPGTGVTLISGFCSNSNDCAVAVLLRDNASFIRGRTFKDWSYALLDQCGRDTQGQIYSC